MIGVWLTPTAYLGVLRRGRQVTGLECVEEGNSSGCAFGDEHELVARAVGGFPHLQDTVTLGGEA
jgi:hypothetical protein